MVPQNQLRSGFGFPVKPIFRAPQVFCYGRRNPVCFRCGGSGHKARSCKLPIRCFNCGRFGHKMQICHEVGKKKAPSLRKEGFDEFFSILTRSQFPEAEEWRDSMLLDPDVAACVHSGLTTSNSLINEVGKQCLDGIAETSIVVSVDPVGSDPAFSLQVEELVSVSQDAQIAEGEGLSVLSHSANGDLVFDPDPIIEEICSSPLPHKITASGIQLVLSPVPSDSFANYFIIDEFEDYYSDEEDGCLASIPQQTTVNKDSDIGVDVSIRGKEIWAHMDRPSFLFYCCVQAVDGFARLERAHARGSNVLSSSLNPKASVYMLYCLPQDYKPESMTRPVFSPVENQLMLSPEKNKTKTSPCKRLPLKKITKTNKRGQGPIMLCADTRSSRSSSLNPKRSSKLDSPASVRRSPRLIKGTSK